MNDIENIKIKHKNPKKIKTIDKTIAWTERIKDPIINTNRTMNNTEENDIDDYGNEKIKYATNRIKDETVNFICKETNKGSNLMKKKIKNYRN